jgi:hypothetical protein
VILSGAAKEKEEQLLKLNTFKIDSVYMNNSKTIGVFKNSNECPNC